MTSKSIGTSTSIPFSFRLKPIVTLLEAIISPSSSVTDVSRAYANKRKPSVPSTIVPDMWVQKLIGQVFIEAEAREQFQEIIEEILRRERKRVRYQQGNNKLDASTVRPLGLSR